MNRRAYTLVELLISIAIVVYALAVVIAAVQKYRSSSQCKIERIAK